MPPPPPGTSKAIIGPTPISEIIGGLFFIVVAVIAASTSSFFAPIAIIIGIIGVVMLALGAMGISLPQEQVVYQSGSSYGQTSASLYDDTPRSFVKPCPRCGQVIPLAALACYHCGAVLE
ncbi:MAG TPA: hypothetical protein VFE96_07430 [Candidatus Bathyarchaeia archaeon]|jgi:hypothetical protein|nr:hypothetical protein [Candidatus Bathyarchaeia archaeon]